MFVTCPRTPIVSLFDTCGPTAIRRFVITVVVHAIDRVFRCGAWPHVGVKRFERVNPALTDTKASAAVIGPFKTGIVRTALLHVGPYAKFRRARHAVFQIFHAHQFTFQATTRMCACQIRALNEHFRAAITTTSVLWMFRIVGHDVFKHFQTSVTCAGRYLRLPRHIREFTVVWLFPREVSLCR